MRKTVIMLLLVGLFVLGVSQVVQAIGPGLGFRSQGVECRSVGFEGLSEEERDNVEAIVESYREDMADLREKALEYRSEGDYEGLREVQEERRELREEKREMLSTYFPEDFQEGFCGPRERMWGGGARGTGGGMMRGGF